MSLEGHNHYKEERILYKVLANDWGNTSNKLSHHCTTFLTMISDVSDCTKLSQSKTLNLTFSYKLIIAVLTILSWPLHKNLKT